MSGYHRQGLPKTVASRPSAIVCSFIGEAEIATVMEAVDPFQVDDACRFSPTGAHYAIGSCGEVVCRYCAKVFWK